jgi:hypothetical protein
MRNQRSKFPATINAPPTEQELKAFDPKTLTGSVPETAHPVNFLHAAHNRGRINLSESLPRLLQLSEYPHVEATSLAVNKCMLFSGK